MKFTEEQYQQIIEGFENKGSYHKRFSLVMDVVNSFTGDYSYEEAFILGLPKSREWAHEQFVEKEKRYVWTSKKRNKYGNSHRLYRDMAQSIGFTSVDKTQKTVQDEYLTESEVREWGYNPEMFDKEEAE